MAVVFGLNSMCAFFASLFGAGAGVSTVEEACTAGRALVGDEMGVVAQNQVVDEGDLVGHVISWLAEPNAGSGWFRIA